jgi:pimeloyl-ACP methyl ester carboxylesterase
VPRVRANGIEVWVEEEGTGPPVVLLMGIACQLTLWPDALVHGLVRSGHRVIRLDNRDVGLTTKLDEHGLPDPGPLIRERLFGRVPDAPYSLHDMAADVVGVLDALGLSDAHVAGASMGGMIAQIVAIEHPERVRSLTSIMSSPGDPWNTLGTPRAGLALLTARAETREEAIEARLRVARVLNGGRAPLDEAETRAQAARDFDRSFHPPGAARQFAAIFATPDRRESLKGVRCPTHVIHGDRDPLIPLRGGRATARRVPGATLQVVRDMGHHLTGVMAEPVLAGIEAAVRRGERSAGRAA